MGVKMTLFYTVQPSSYIEHADNLSSLLICQSHLFSSHRQHAAALLHTDWLVLGPRAERSRTQAAEQVESQDRRGQWSQQAQTGVRSGHRGPPLELSQLQLLRSIYPNLNLEADTNQVSLASKVKKGIYTSSRSSRFGLWLLMFCFQKAKRSRKYTLKREDQVGFFGESLWVTPLRVHDERESLPKLQNIYPSIWENCLHNNFPILPQKWKLPTLESSNRFFFFFWSPFSGSTIGLVTRIQMLLGKSLFVWLPHLGILSVLRPNPIWQYSSWFASP